MSQRVAILRRPLLPVIKIQKNDGSVYTFNKFAGMYDFRLRSVRIVPASDGLGGYFQLKIAHPNPSTLVSMAQNLERGNEVKIWIGKTDVSGSSAPRFLGVIEKKTFLEPFRSWADLVLTGVDWGSAIEHNRVLNGYYEQRKLGDGITPDPTDDSTKIQKIIIDMLTNRDKYLLPGISIQDQGGIINPNNIVDSGRQLDNFKIDSQQASDVLSTLDDEDGTIHYWDGDKRFIRKFPTATPSGILLTDDPSDPVALGWSQDKVGLILPDTTFDVNSEERVAVLMGLGGDQVAIDKKQEDISTTTALTTNHYAMKFRPQIRDYVKIQVAVGKIGTPPADLGVLIVEDDGNGNPLGTEIRKLTIKASEISTTTEIASDPLKAWRTLTLGEEQLNTAKDHWIILEKVGGNASNTIVWYGHTSAGSSGISKFSTDLQNWSSDTKQFAFRTYYKQPVLAIYVKPGGTSAQDKYYRERVIKKPSITDIQEMYAYLSGQKPFYFNDRQIFKARILAPDTIMDNLQQVRIRKQKTKYTFDYDDFVVSGIEWIFQDRIGTFYYDATFIRFAP